MRGSAQRASLLGPHVSVNSASFVQRSAPAWSSACACTKTSTDEAKVRMTMARSMRILRPLVLSMMTESNARSPALTRPPVPDAQTRGHRRPRCSTQGLDSGPRSEHRPPSRPSVDEARLSIRRAITRADTHRLPSKEPLLRVCVLPERSAVSGRPTAEARCTTHGKTRCNDRLSVWLPGSSAESTWVSAPRSSKSAEKLAPSSSALELCAPLSARGLVMLQPGGPVSEGLAARFKPSSAASAVTAASVWQSGSSPGRLMNTLDAETCTAGSWAAHALTTSCAGISWPAQTSSRHSPLARCAQRAPLLPR